MSATEGNVGHGEPAPQEREPRDVRTPVICSACWAQVLRFEEVDGFLIAIPCRHGVGLLRGMATERD